MPALVAVAVGVALVLEGAVLEGGQGAAAPAPADQQQHRRQQPPQDLESRAERGGGEQRRRIGALRAGWCIARIWSRGALAIRR
eukprot:scaffold37857_cov202-Isochrysis_galbana.AAC.1